MKPDNRMLRMPVLETFVDDDVSDAKLSVDSYAATAIVSTSLECRRC